MQVYLAQQCIIVKHLLEVRYKPVTVGSITVKATTYLVIDSTLGHFPKGQRYYLQSVFVLTAKMVSQQKLKHQWLGKLGGRTEAPLCVVKASPGGGIGLT